MFLLTITAFALLCGCSGSGSTPLPEAEAAETAEDTPAPTATPEREAAPPREVDFVDSSFHEDLAEGNDSVLVDISSANEGYIAVAGFSDSRLKVQIVKGDETYTYDMVSDGTPSVFPLQCGDGDYTVRVMENIVDSKYAELYTTSCSVTLTDEFQPFIRPNDYVSYSQSSQCVKKAAEISGGAEGPVDVVAAVYDYICASVTYDNEKAATVTSGYLPDPDETLKTGQGICFDYASLAAAMLRSQGVPTKLIFGYVSPDGLYHAWNMFYTDETGWVTAEFEVSADSWNRIDLTFSANGAGNDFIGDGSNYSDLYCY